MKWNWVLRQRRYRVDTEGLQAVLDGAARLLALDDETVTIVLGNDRLTRQLKGTYLGIPEATDVLAFPLQETLPDGERYLGDIVISVETAARQAREKNIPLEQELAILLIHGLLHLLGYDHETDQGEMRQLETELRQALLTNVAPKGKN